MPAFFVQNQSAPVPSVHRAGLRYDGDNVASAIASFVAAHPPSPGDALEAVAASAFSFFTVAQVLSFPPAAAPPLPAVGS